MRSDRIRIRNLDREVLEYFRNINQKITFDSLDESIVTEIKNGEGTNKYNDAELRSRIISLENKKLAAADAENIYAKKVDTYSKTETDALFSSFNNTHNSKLSLEEAKDVFIEKKAGAVTEDLLSVDLINKVNARYENKRPDGSSGSGDVSTGDFNLLKVQVNNNTTSISTLEEYINQNVLTTSDKIGLASLDSAVAEIINTARIDTVPIEMNDLSQDIQNKLNNTVSGSFDSLETNINNNKQKIDEINELLSVAHGEVIIGAIKNSDGDQSVNIQHSYILLDNTIICPTPSQLTEVMDYAVEDEIEHVVDIENNILYTYTSGSWATNTTYAAASEFLAGKFVLEYGTGSLYFGYSPEEIDFVINLSEVAKKADLTDYLTNSVAAATYSSKSDISTINTNIATLTSKDTEIENKIATLTSKDTEIEGKIATLTSKDTEIENNVSTLTTNNSSLDSRITSLETAIQALDQLETTIDELTAEIEALKAKVDNSSGGETA